MTIYFNLCLAWYVFVALALRMMPLLVKSHLGAPDLVTILEPMKQATVVPNGCSWPRKWVKKSHN